MKELLEQLIEMDAKEVRTGRKDYKKLSEIQMKMLIDSHKNAQQGAATTDKLLGKYSELEKVTTLLEEENNLLFWQVQEFANGAMYSA